MKKPNRKSPHGFTLTELMVAIVIIMVLASTVFVGSKRSIEKARGVSCMHNLRQVGMMMNGAASENSGLYPHGGPPRGWISRLCEEMASDYPNSGGRNDAPFFRDGAGKVFCCPSDEDGQSQLHKSYLANPWVVGAMTGEGEWLGNGSFKPKRVQSIKHPARVFLVVEDWTRDSAHWRGNGLRYKGDLKKDQDHPAHGEGRNYLYVDGHVEFLARDPGLDPDGYEIHYKAK